MDKRGFRAGKLQAREILHVLGELLGRVESVACRGASLFGEGRREREREKERKKSSKEGGGEVEWQGE
jgi:hypothetical protein